MKTKVSAAIVTYKCYDKCKDAVKSLLEYTKNVDMTVYVIDNNSEDQTLKKLKAEFPEIITIQNPDNKGFGYGHNKVLELLNSKYHFVVNPDIVIDRDVLSDISTFFDKNPDIGLVTPQILNPDKTDQLLPKRNPTVAALVGRRIFGDALKDQIEHYQMLDEDLTKTIDIEFATGCFFGIRTDIYKLIGGFDERFFIYFEDMDITRRAKNIKRTVYYPKTYVYHAWERSSAKSLKYFVILIKGMFKYFGKWGWQFRYKLKK